MAGQLQQHRETITSLQSALQESENSCNELKQSLATSDQQLKHLKKAVVPAKNKEIDDLSKRLKDVERDFRELQESRYVVARDEIRMWNDTKIDQVEFSLFKGIQALNMERGQREDRSHGIVPLNAVPDPMQSQSQPKNEDNLDTLP